MVNHKYQQHFATSFLLAIAMVTGSTDSLAASDLNIEPKMDVDITATSQYLWRGLSLTADAAIQGGANFTDPSGLHGQIWTSSIAGGTETRFGVGFEGRFDSFKYNVGARLYYLPQYTDSNFVEVYLGFIAGDFGAQVSVSPDAGSYAEAFYTLPLEIWDLTVHAGVYSVDDKDGGVTIPIEDYVDYSLALSRNMDGYDIEFKLADTNLAEGDTKNGLDSSDLRTIVSISKNFNK